MKTPQIGTRVTHKRFKSGGKVEAVNTSAAPPTVLVTWDTRRVRRTASLLGQNQSHVNVTSLRW